MQTLIDELLQPAKAYNGSLQNRHEVYTKDLFESLISESGIDVSENRRTVKAYQQELEKISQIGKVLSKLRALRAFIVMLAIAGIVALAFCVFQKQYLWAALGAVTAVGAIIICIKILNPKIKSSDEIKQGYEKRADELLKQAWEQMAPLNALFDSDMTRQLVQKTVPIITIDKNFNVHRYDYLHSNFGYSDPNNFPKLSTIGVLSGEINGNPYVIERYMRQNMGTATYTGELTIEWVEYYEDSEGNRCRLDRSETLTAEVTKPKPYYDYETILTYGNEAAPDLSFTHDPTHAEAMSERQLSRFVKSESKRIQKAARKAVASGTSNFTPLGNDEFDVLFNAVDRDNEVQFRMLFTPLAQKNLLELMKNPVPYGDNFRLSKRCMLNWVAAEHANDWNMDTSTDKYKSFDVDASFNSFVNFNTEYFKCFFFEFAPLLAIPLYQQHKPREYIYRRDRDLPRNYTAHEAEVLANAIGTSVFKHSSTATNVILKTDIASKDGESDIVNVTAHSFKTVERCDYVSVYGGDGHYHDVPVYWYEYIPIKRTRSMEMRELNLCDKDYLNKLNEENFRNYTLKHNSNFAYRDGIFACALNCDDRLNGIL